MPVLSQRLDRSCYVTAGTDVSLSLGFTREAAAATSGCGGVEKTSVRKAAHMSVYSCGQPFSFCVCGGYISYFG